MRTILLGAALLIAIPVSAIAADLRQPVYKVAPSVIPAWSWTGCYVGGHAGYLRGESQDWTPRTPGGAHIGESLGSHDLKSWTRRDGRIGPWEDGGNKDINPITESSACAVGWVERSETHQFR